MKKKLIISVLLVVCFFAITILSISKVNAEEILIVDSQYLYYDDDVKEQLLNIPINSQNGLPIVYRSNGPVHTLNSDGPYGLNGVLSMQYFITSISTDIEYISMPDFDVGYYIDFNTIELKYIYTIGSDYNAVGNYEIFLDDSLVWYDAMSGEVYDEFRYYTGFDKSNINVGTYPDSFIPITSLEQTSINIYFTMYLTEYQNQPVFTLELDFNSFNGYQSIYCFIPTNNFSGLGGYDLSSYIGHTTNSSYLSQPEIYTPMAYFTYKRIIQDNAFDEGFDEGFDKGKLEGYKEGQASLDISFTDWISTAVGGFLDFELVPGLSLMSVLSFIISLGLLFLILRFFSGG